MTISLIGVILPVWLLVDLVLAIFIGRVLRAERRSLAKPVGPEVIETAVSSRSADPIPMPVVLAA